MAAPAAAIASPAAVLAARHCSSSAPRSCGAMKVKYSEAPVGYRCETWHMTSPGVPRSASAAWMAAPTVSWVLPSADHGHAVSRVSTITPRSISSSRRYGAAKRPSCQALPQRSPRNTPPAARSISAKRPRRRVTSSSEPSNPAISRQPFSWPRRRR